jgi:hypothetical protein
LYDFITCAGYQCFSFSSSFYILFFSLSQLNEKEDRENIAASPEGSASGEDSSDSGEGGSGGSSSSSSSNEGMHALKAVCIFLYIRLAFLNNCFCKL